jgi:hypothetical protein
MKPGITKELLIAVGIAVSVFTPVTYVSLEIAHMIAEQASKIIS